MRKVTPLTKWFSHENTSTANIPNSVMRVDCRAVLFFISNAAAAIVLEFSSYS